MTENDSVQSSLAKPHKEFFYNPFALRASFECASQKKSSSLATSPVSPIFQIKWENIFCCILSELQNRSQEGDAQFIMLRFLRALEKACSFYTTELSWPIGSADTHQVAQVLLSGCPCEYRILLSCEVSWISGCFPTNKLSTAVAVLDAGQVA